MKKLAVCTMAALMLFAFSPVQLNAATEPAPVAATSPVAIATMESSLLVERLSEIKDMDRSALNYSQKKELRKEVRTIKSELKQRGDGLYISVGAAIIIVILLIILL
jgi:hypothetical protein